MPAADPRAHAAVHKALKSGVLVRPDRCEKCGKRCKPHAHHDDYSKPLEVRWLCPTCHRREPLGANGRDDLTVQINLRLDDELFARLEAARGDVPRNRWLIRAAEQALRGPALAPRHQPGPDVSNVRSSRQAKAAVKPIPKNGGKR